MSAQIGGLEDVSVVEDVSLDELGDKGFPPFFLQMVNDLRAISGAVRFRTDGATVELEVRL